MRFREKKTKGVIAGHFIDDAERQIEVRFDKDGYKCRYRDSILTATNTDELMGKYTMAAGFVRNWQDVILVRITVDVFGTCPPSLSAALSFQPIHIAQTHTGHWVYVEWGRKDNPLATERSINVPEDMELPCSINERFCNKGTTETLVAYSDSAVADLKRKQTELQIAVEKIREGLLKSE